MHLLVRETTGGNAKRLLQASATPPDADGRVNGPAQKEGRGTCPDLIVEGCYWLNGRGTRQGVLNSHVYAPGAGPSPKEGRDREPDEQQDTRREGRHDHPGVRGDQGVRVRPRLLEPRQRLPREGQGEHGEEGPWRQAREDDAEDEDEVRGPDDPAEHGRRARDAEPHDEGPLPHGAVRGDVRDLVDPQDPRHEEAEGNRQDDRRGVERPRENVV